MNEPTKIWILKRLPLALGISSLIVGFVVQKGSCAPWGYQWMFWHT